MQHDQPPRVKVSGEDLLDLRDHMVGWYTFPCGDHDDHEHQMVAVELVFGPLDPAKDDGIEKSARLTMNAVQAFDLGNALVAAANRAAFLEWHDAPEDE